MFFKRKIRFNDQKEHDGGILSGEEMVSYFSQEEKAIGLNEDRLKELLSAYNLEDVEDERFSLLIVEDEEYMREILADHLAEYYDVITAVDGSEVLKLASEIKEIDLVILDIGLPDILGIELIPKLKELHKNAAVIMLTAFKDMDSIVASFKNEAIEYITKPFNIENLLESILSALKRRNLRKYLNTAKDICLSGLIPESRKINILNKIAKRKLEKNSSLTMQDIYLMFPELKKSGVPASEVISDETAEEGVLHIIEELREKSDLAK